MHLWSADDGRQPAAAAAWRSRCNRTAAAAAVAVMQIYYVQRVQNNTREQCVRVCVRVCA